tara:strand:+ start:1951 stop:2733 length:783 start_codon:yes stop_codon:yes gene_type:complete
MTTDTVAETQTEPFVPAEDAPLTTEASEEEASTLEDKASEEDKATKEEKEPSEDWQARAEAAEARAKTVEGQLEKERRDRRSQRIQAAKAIERDQLQQESIANQRLILKALGKTNPEIADELAQQSETNQTEGQKRINDERALQASDELREIARDVGLNTDEAIQAHPEFKNVMLFWRLGGFEEALGEARIAQGKIEAGAAKGEAIKTKAAAPPKPNVSTETGSGSGGAGKTIQQIEADSAAGKPITLEEDRRLRKHWST